MQFASAPFAPSASAPARCMPYAAGSPIFYTYNVTYGPGSKVSYFQASGVPIINYKGVNYFYPRGQDR